MSEYLLNKAIEECVPRFMAGATGHKMEEITSVLMSFYYDAMPFSLFTFLWSELGVADKHIECVGEILLKVS